MNKRNPRLAATSQGPLGRMWNRIVIRFWRWQWESGRIKMSVHNLEHNIRVNYAQRGK